MDIHTYTAEELYALYHQEIVRFFAEHLADREAAWDLCHEVFVRLLITLASGTQLRSPQRWLLRVAKNLLIDTYRHQHAAEAPLPLESQELAMLATMGLVRKIAQELRDHGTYETMSHEGYRRAEAQALFASGGRRSRWRYESRSNALCQRHCRNLQTIGALEGTGL
jgi:DNA-directed RNA polymerase specialized sigma24 family protein